MPRYILVSMLLCLHLATIPSAAASPQERLAQAVRYATISYQDRERIDYDQFLALHDYLRVTFPRVFGELQVETVNGYSLLLHWPGTQPDLKPILFTAHLDVVPIEPGTEGDWSQPPFAGVVDGDRIYGRGTLDDKQGVLSLLEAAESLLAEGFRPQRSVVFAFGHDEEIGGGEGAAKLAERMREHGWHFAWMVDEGGMIVTDNPLLPGRPVAIVNVAEKGYLTLTLVATGEGGHSSRPPRESTIGRLSRALAKIESNPFPTRLVPPVDVMLESMGAHMDQPQRFIFDNLWLTGGLVAGQMAEDSLTNSYVRTTTALTMFNAGVKENVIPQRAEAKVNFRLLPGDTPEFVVDRIREIIDDDSIDITYDRWANIPPVSDHQGPGFGVIANAVLSEYPQALVVPSLLTATTDTRHYIGSADDLYRFHGMLISTSQAKSVHGTDEYIDVDSYLKCIAVARGMLELGARGAPATP